MARGYVWVCFPVPSDFVYAKFKAPASLLLCARLFERLLLADGISTKSPCVAYTVRPVLSGHSKRSVKIGLQYLLPLNASQKY